LNEIDLINLFGDNLSNLKKLALPRNTTDDVIKCICTQSSFVLSLTHLNLSSCPSLSNRSILLINKYLLSLEELTINYNVNINDFAFIGLSICGIGKSIEWLDQTLINRQLIDDLPIWTYTITHQTLCKCQLPRYISSSCIKLRLKDFNFDYDEYSDRILFMLTEHKLFNEYFYSINKLKKLKSLKLRQCIQLTNRLFRFGIRALPNLKYLDISACEKFDDKNLSLIGQACPSIETIDLNGCHRITENGKQILKTNAKRVKIIEY
jgi:EIN3-binding F-box protein